MNSPHKGPATQEMIPFDDVVMFFVTFILSLEETIISGTLRQQEVYIQNTTKIYTSFSLTNNILLPIDNCLLRSRQWEHNTIRISSFNYSALSFYKERYVLP